MLPRIEWPFRKVRVEVLRILGDFITKPFGRIKLLRFGFKFDFCDYQASVGAKEFVNFPVQSTMLYHAPGFLGNSTFVARTFSRFEARTEGAGISGCKPPGLVACDFCVRSR